MESHFMIFILSGGHCVISDLLKWLRKMWGRLLDFVRIAKFDDEIECFYSEGS